MKAIRAPPAPYRGVSSMSRTPLALSSASASSMSATRKATVVDTLPFRCKEFSDRSLRIGRLEQLDFALSHGHEGGLHLLLGDLFDAVKRKPQYPFPHRKGCIDLFDCNADMVKREDLHASLLGSECCEKAPSRRCRCPTCAKTLAALDHPRLLKALEG